MNTKLHVGNLSAHVTDADLLDKFGGFGLVSFAMVMKDDLSGGSRGFGLVEMADLAGAEQAIASKYSDEAETELKASVVAGGGTFDFELTSGT